MADKNLRINISVTGAEKTRAQIKKTTQGIGNMRLTTAGLRREIGKLRNVWLLWQFVMKPTLKLIRETTDALFEQEKAEAKLRRGLDNVATATTGGADKLIDYAAALQQVTTFGDEQIISAAAILATFQLNSDAIGHILPRLLDMSTSYAELETNALLLGKAFTGNAASLSRVGVQFDQMELKAAQVAGTVSEFNFLIEALDENYLGLAETMIKTKYGEMENFEKRISDVKERVGESMVIFRQWGQNLRMFFIFGVAEAIHWLKVLKISLKGVVTLEFNRMGKELKELTEEWEKWRDGIKNTTNRLNKFHFAQGKTNQQLKIQQGLMKDQVMLMTEIAVAQNEQLGFKYKLNAVGQVEISSFKKMHPLQEKGVRLRGEMIALEDEAFQMRLNNLPVTEKNQTAQIRVQMQLKDTEAALHEARIKQSADFIGALGSVAGAHKKTAKVSARLAQISAFIDMWGAAQAAFRLGGGYPLGVLPMATTVAMGLANIAKISASIGDFGSAQFGMDQIVSKPTLILTGEQNKRERVQVTPLQSPNLHGSSSGGVVVNINAPLVDETVRDSIIPSIQRALRSNAA
jgi:hypothetical protein